MFNKFKNRLNQPSYQGNYPQYDNNNYSYNQYDFYRIDEQLNELKRINNDLIKRITRLENYLGIRSESDASNYYNN